MNVCTHPHTQFPGGFDSDKATICQTYKQRQLPVTTAALLVQITCKLGIMKVLWHLPVLGENTMASII